MYVRPHYLPRIIRHCAEISSRPSPAEQHRHLLDSFSLGLEVNTTTEPTGSHETEVSENYITSGFHDTSTTKESKYTDDSFHIV